MDGLPFASPCEAYDAPPTWGPAMPRPDEEDLFADTTMTFGEHLEELRLCLFRALVGLMLAFVVSLFFASHVVRVIEEPLKEALEAYYQQQAADKMEDQLERLREAGYRLPSTNERLNTPCKIGKRLDPGVQDHAAVRLNVYLIQSPDEISKGDHPER